MRAVTLGEEEAKKLIQEVKEEAKEDEDGDKKLKTVKVEISKDDENKDIYLKKLSFAEATKLIYKNKYLAKIISLDDWTAARYSGVRLVRFFAPDAKEIKKKAMKVLKLNDEQINKFTEYL